MPPTHEQMYINDNFTQNSESNFQNQVCSSREYLTTTDHNFAVIEDARPPEEGPEDLHRWLTQTQIS